MPEPHDTRLRRLTMRSMRRGILEMDILLSRYARARLPALDAGALETYDALLEESDQDLYQWISGQTPAPQRYRAMIADIARVPATA